MKARPFFFVGVGMTGIDQVSLELGQLKANYAALKGTMDGAARTVQQLARDVAEIRGEASARRSMLEQVLGEIRELGAAVAHLNDVDRKLLDMGFRKEDAKSHRQDQLLLRKVRRAIEFTVRHAGKALVMGAAAALAVGALQNYPLALKLLEHFLE